MLKIQRVPRGLNELLSIAGGQTPTHLHDNVQASIELLQFYAMQQLQTSFTNNPALAEGSSVAVITPNAWCLLFGAAFTITKTATATALRATISLQRTTGVQTPLVSQDLGPFGATETGACNLCFWAPYPILLPPLSQIVGVLNILGTDANAATTIRAEFGVIG